MMADDVPIGARVVIDGLHKNPGYNGQEAVVLSKSERWGVQLVVDGRQLAIRRENLVACPSVHERIDNDVLQMILERCEVPSLRAASVTGRALRAAAVDVLASSQFHRRLEDTRLYEWHKSELADCRVIRLDPSRRKPLFAPRPVQRFTPGRISVRNGALIAHAASDGEAALWDATTGTRLARTTRPEVRVYHFEASEGEGPMKPCPPIWQLALSPSGRLLAAGTKTGNHSWSTSYLELAHLLLYETTRVGVSTRGGRMQPLSYTACSHDIFGRGRRVGSTIEALAWASDATLLSLHHVGVNRRNGRVIDTPATVLCVWDVDEQANGQRAWTPRMVVESEHSDLSKSMELMAAASDTAVASLTGGVMRVWSIPPKSHEQTSAAPVELRSFPAGHKPGNDSTNGATLSAIALSASASRVATAGRTDAAVRVHAVSTGDCVAILDYESNISCARWYRDWIQAQSAQRLRRAHSEFEYATAGLTALHLDGESTLITGDDNGCVNVWLLYKMSQGRPSNPASVDHVLTECAKLRAEYESLLDPEELDELCSNFLEGASLRSEAMLAPMHAAVVSLPEANTKEYLSAVSGIAGAETDGLPTAGRAVVVANEAGTLTKVMLPTTIDQANAPRPRQGPREMGRHPDVPHPHTASEPRSHQPTATYLY